MENAKINGAVLAVGATFFLLGICIQYVSSEAILAFISKSGGGKECMYWIESVVAVSVLCIPGMIMMRTGMRGKDKAKVICALISIVLGVAFLLRGMYHLYNHIGDDASFVTFNVMTLSAATQCFAAALFSFSNMIRSDMFD